MKYEILLADVDDTLLDFHSAERNALIKTHENFNVSYNDKHLNTYSEINDSLWKAFERGEISSSDEIARVRFGLYFKKRGITAVDEIAFKQEYEKNLALSAFIFPDVFPALTEIKAKANLYLVTNGRTSIQKSRLALSGLDAIADGIFISELIGFKKPEEKYFDYVKDNIPGFDKTKALLIGDSLTADMPAHKLGIATCLIDRKNKYSNRTLDDVDYIINSFDEVKKFF